MAATDPKATVSGPGVDKGYPSPQVALSVAVTLASQAPAQATFYVRDHTGEVYGRTERDEHGNVQVWRTTDSRTPA